MRSLYLREPLAAIPRLIASVNRNPYSKTYGCFDREYWHYRTSAFPSAMHQEAVLPLAMAYHFPLPGSQYYKEPRLREFVIAGLQFSARSSHRDGSCDDYYPYERALGAAVFSLGAAARAYQLLQLDLPEAIDWFDRCGRWIIRNGETGRLTNHHALAAIALWRVYEITNDVAFRQAAHDRVGLVLSWQNDEGWFDEYGGADPGYQTVTLDCLAKYYRATGDERVVAPLRRGVAFARQFLHPDDSYAGDYGSRGSRHFYPHGFELLAETNADAADLADGYLRSLVSETEARFTDDRLYVHRLANSMEAYLDWSADRAVDGAPPPANDTRHFPNASILVRREGDAHTVISGARGGAFRHFTADGYSTGDAGMLIETTDGRVAVSQQHVAPATAEWRCNESGGDEYIVHKTLSWTRFETVTPWKQTLLHLGMCTVGRWMRSLARRLLQARLITGRRPAPIELIRTFEFANDRLRVIDRVRLLDHRLRVRRMAFGVDFQSAYVAASEVYQNASLDPWTDLTPYVDRLNRDRRLTVVRQW